MQKNCKRYKCRKGCMRSERAVSWNVLPYFDWFPGALLPNYTARHKQILLIRVFIIVAL
jgi:hypothetical protein